MDMPWKIIGLVSLAETTAITQLAPRYRYPIPLPYTLLLFSLFFAHVIFVLIWNVILYPKFFSPLRHLPRPSGGSFLNGHFKEITSLPSGTPLQKWNNEIPNEGLIYYNFFLNAERILVTSPKALAEVLHHKSYDFVKPRQLVQGIGRILGIGILLAEGDEHKVQRKNLMPAFHYRHIKDLYPIFWGKSREMVEALSQISQPKGTEPVKCLKAAPVVEMSSWVSRATLDIIGLAGIGQDFNALKDPTNELNRTYQTIFGSPSPSQASFVGMLALFLPFWLLRRLPFKRNIEISAASATIRRISRQLIDQKKARLDRNEKDDDVDILSVALKSGGFTEENLVDQMMTFFAAGHETTSTAMAWAVHVLSLNPEVQTRLREEIRQSLPSVDHADSLVTAQILDRLPYLHAVCNEILRVHPPVVITLREAARDTTILGTFVPKGTRIILAPWAVNMSTALWGDDPAKFNPERWMGNGRANTGGAESNYSFLTFLHGPRSCIGQSFAKAEFACLLAAVVGRFEFEPEDPNKEFKVQEGITLKPRDGVSVRLRLIEGW